MGMSLLQQNLGVIVEVLQLLAERNRLDLPEFVAAVNFHVETGCYKAVVMLSRKDANGKWEFPQGKHEWFATGASYEEAILALVEQLYEPLKTRHNGDKDLMARFDTCFKLKGEDNVQPKPVVERFRQIGLRSL